MMQAEEAVSRIKVQTLTTNNNISLNAVKLTTLTNIIFFCFLQALVSKHCCVTYCMFLFLSGSLPEQNCLVKVDLKFRLQSL